jgi:hypothetical protein
MERLTNRNYGEISHTGRIIPYSTHCIGCITEDCDCGIVEDMVKKLADYEDLEEQGRLVILPCDRGDKIYFIKSAFSMAHFPIEAKVTSICGIDCDSDVMYSSITEYNKIDRRFKSSDIGKTVFLTKSEAEAKLKELRSNND